MSYNNKQFSEIINHLSNNNSENEIMNKFFNLFGLIIIYSRHNTKDYVTDDGKIIYMIIMEHNFCNYKRNDGIQQVSENYFLEIIDKFIKGEYCLKINVKKYSVSFVFKKYEKEKILKLKNMNIYKNYWKYNEIYHDDYVQNQEYLYTTENLNELTYDKLFKLINNDQYMKISYFNNMKNQKCDVRFWFF